MSYKELCPAPQAEVLAADMCLHHLPGPVIHQRQSNRPRFLLGQFPDRLLDLLADQQEVSWRQRQGLFLSLSGLLHSIRHARALTRLLRSLVDQLLCCTAPTQSRHYGKGKAVAWKQRRSPQSAVANSQREDLAEDSIQPHPEAVRGPRGLACDVAVAGVKMPGAARTRCVSRPGSPPPRPRRGSGRSWCRQRWRCCTPR